MAIFLILELTGSQVNPNMLKHSYDYEAAYLLQFRPDYFH